MHPSSQLGIVTHHETPPERPPPSSRRTTIRYKEVPADPDDRTPAVQTGGFVVKGPATNPATTENAQNLVSQRRRSAFSRLMHKLSASPSWPTEEREQTPSADPEAQGQIDTRRGTWPFRRPAKDTTRDIHVVPAHAKDEHGVLHPGYNSKGQRTLRDTVDQHGWRKVIWNYASAARSGRVPLPDRVQHREPVDPLATKDDLRPTSGAAETHATRQQSDTLPPQVEEPPFGAGQSGTTSRQGESPKPMVLGIAPVGEEATADADEEPLVDFREKPRPRSRTSSSGRRVSDAASTTNPFRRAASNENTPPLSLQTGNTQAHALTTGLAHNVVQRIGSTTSEPMSPMDTRHTSVASTSRTPGWSHADASDISAVPNESLVQIRGILNWFLSHEGQESVNTAMRLAPLFGQWLDQEQTRRDSGAPMQEKAGDVTASSRVERPRPSVVG